MEDKKPSNENFRLILRLLELLERLIPAILTSFYERAKLNIIKAKAKAEVMEIRADVADKKAEIATENRNKTPKQIIEDFLKRVKGK